MRQCLTLPSRIACAAPGPILWTENRITWTYLDAFCCDRGASLQMRIAIANQAIEDNTTVGLRRLGAGTGVVRYRSQQGFIRTLILAFPGHDREILERQMYPILAIKSCWVMVGLFVTGTMTLGCMPDNIPRR